MLCPGSLLVYDMVMNASVHSCDCLQAAQKQREKELEKMDISEYRKSLTFKAGSMPTFR